MITLAAFDKCPICSRAGQANEWKKINHNVIWWERMCSNFHDLCGFTQHYWKSFEDTELRYLQFKIKDFYAYTYTTAYAEEAHYMGIISGTRFYHNEFPRGEIVQGPFQDWKDYVPDWDNLDKLNQKLNLLKTFA